MITNAMILFAFMTGPTEAAPAWSNDYWQARTEGKAQNKPLAVVVGAGADGQAKVCREGRLSDRLQNALSEHYVAVYVDSSEPDGKSLAQQLGIKSGVGIVISDRSGDYQSFNHDGSLSEAELIRQLERARTTQVRTSFYQPTTINAGSTPSASIRVRSC